MSPAVASVRTGAIDRGHRAGAADDLGQGRDRWTFGAKELGTDQRRG